MKLGYQGVVLGLSLLFSFGGGFSSASAETEAKTAAATSAPAEDTRPGHIEMHEKMAELNKKAAECLKAGKPQDECRAEFKAGMKESGAGYKGHHSKDHHGKNGKHDENGMMHEGCESHCKADECGDKCDHPCKGDSTCPMKGKKKAARKAK